MYRTFLFGLCFLVSQSCLAWNNTYFDLTHGSKYQFGKSSQERLTLAHSSSWKYGDTFFYFTVAEFVSKNPVIFGEIAPAISLSKYLQKDVLGPLFSDVQLSGQMYYDETGSREFSAGGTVYWRLHPNIKYLSTRLHYRKDPSIPGSTFALIGSTQITLGPWFFANAHADWVPKNQGKNNNIKHRRWLALADAFIDVGNFFDRPYYVYLGPSYSYTRNKLGIKGRNERVLRAKLRIYF